MKKKTVQARLAECRMSLQEEIEIWKRINTNGCNDPFWSDGCNMNLIRNHIIYYKREIVQICEENSLALPEEYYLPLPPEVDDKYMAKLDQKERVQRIRHRGGKLTTKKAEYDDTQMSLF